MEQGGLAVKWTAGAANAVELDASACASPERLAAEVFRLLIERHESLWRRST
jgi:hypothetical protein